MLILFLFDQIFKSLITTCYIVLVKYFKSSFKMIKYKETNIFNTLVSIFLFAGTVLGTRNLS